MKLVEGPQSGQGMPCRPVSEEEAHTPKSQTCLVVDDDCVLCRVLQTMFASGWALPNGW